MVGDEERPHGTVVGAGKSVGSSKTPVNVERVDVRGGGAQYWRETAQCG